MVWKSDVPSSHTGVSVQGLARLMGLTPARVYQKIGEGEIPAPSIKLNEQQRVYPLDEAMKIWKEHAAEGVFVDLRVSSNQSR